MQVKVLSKGGALLVLIALVVFSATRRDGSGVPPEREASTPTAGPTRILPASVAAVEWLVELVPAERVVAVPEQLESFSGVISDTAWTPGWAARPRFARFTSEIALAFDPDLVLVSPFTDGAMVDRVRDAGAEVLTLSEPTTWDELRGACHELGELVDAEQRAAQLWSGLEARRDALVEAAPVPPLRVLAYGNYGSSAMTTGTGMPLDLAMRLAGLVNVAAEAGMRGPADLASEVILSLTFDAVLVSGTSDDSQSAAALRTDPALAGIDAVREERFLYLPVALHVAGSHTILDAAEALAEQAHALDER